MKRVVKTSYYRGLDEGYSCGYSCGFEYGNDYSKVDDNEEDEGY